MYRQRFGLTALPFEPPASSDDLFVSVAARETETRLKHLLELRGIGLLTGEAGCGKTSACRRVLDSLHPGRYRVAYLALTAGSVLDTCQAIAWSLGLDPPRYRAQICRAIRTEVVRLSREAGQLPLLVIDEAQYLRDDVLRELRLLTNYGHDSERRLCLLLVGLSPLRRRLALRVHESLAQRIVMRYRLPGLGRDEIGPYLTHCLRRAGCELPLFGPDSREALFEASRGRPRLVSRLAHYALAAAALEKAGSVSAEHVRHACAEVGP